MYRLKKRQKLAISVVAAEMFLNSGIMPNSAQKMEVMGYISALALAPKSLIINMEVCSLFREDHMRMPLFPEKWLDKYIQQDFLHCSE